MGADEKFTNVEEALSAVGDMLTLDQIKAATGLDDKAARAELKALAQQGQIDHIPARGQHVGRYGLLATKAKTASQELNEQALLGVIYDIRKAIGDPEGKIMLGDLAERIGTIYSNCNDFGRAIHSAGQSVGLKAGQDVCKYTVLAIEIMKAELANERQARQALQEQLDADPGIDIKDAATGYVMLASKRKPRRITTPENAREAAIAAIRAGAQRAEVFALVPVGRAVRGAVWKDS